MKEETEIEKALKLANKFLDEPYADPDDDLCLLSRQLIRTKETTHKDCIGRRTLAEELGKKWNVGVDASFKNGYNQALQDLKDKLLKKDGLDS